MKNIIKIVGMTTILSLWHPLLAQEVGDSVHGAELWSSVCTRCHNIREPADLSKRAWKYSMNHMRIRAGLTGKETRDILAFILESKTVEDSR